MKRAVAWAGAVGLIVLAARTVVYALSPSPLATALAHEAGGPALPLIALVSLGLGLTLAVAIVWLAAIGVAERRQLETRTLVDEPRLRLGVLCARAVVLFAASSVTFALVESTIHWRAGLGWHGLHCLTGPVHRDAIPILGGFSLVAAALAAALDHVLAWMRRTLARLAGAERPVAQRARLGLRPLFAPTPAAAAAALARGPPPTS
jgi:hypothetical protein